jgi:hypothetical protein
LITKVLARSTVLDAVLSNENEAFRSRVGYLKQISLTPESESSTGVTLWPLDDMVRLLQTVHGDCLKVQGAVEEASSLRRRLRFKYSKAINAGLFHSQEDVETFNLDMTVLDSHLRFLGKLLNVIDTRITVLLSRQSSASGFEEAALKKKALVFQDDVLQMKSKLNHMKRLVGVGFGPLGVIELLSVPAMLNKLEFIHLVQLKQFSRLQLAIKYAIRMYKRSESTPFCPFEHLRSLNCWCQIVRYRFNSLTDSALWLTRKIKTDAKRLLQDSATISLLSSMHSIQADLLKTLTRWEKTVERLERLASALLLNKRQIRSGCH